MNLDYIACLMPDYSALSHNKFKNSQPPHSLMQTLMASVLHDPWLVSVEQTKGELHQMLGADALEPFHWELFLCSHCGC